MRALRQRKTGIGIDEMTRVAVFPHRQIKMSQGNAHIQFLNVAEGAFLQRLLFKKVDRVAADNGAPGLTIGGRRRPSRHLQSA